METTSTGVIENSIAARVLPLRSSLIIPRSGQSEEKTVKSDYLDEDVRNLIGEVYAGK